MLRGRAVLPLAVVFFVACGEGAPEGPLVPGLEPNGSGASSGTSPGTPDTKPGASPGEEPHAGNPNNVPPNLEFRGPLNMGADPFMTFHDGFYYLSTTQGDALRMWKARTVGELLVSQPKTIWTDTDPSRNQQIWAPSFTFIEGHWYVVYTASNGVDDTHRLYVIESDGADALGPYHFKAKLAAPGSDVWAIDGELLKHDNKLYIAWSGQNTNGARNLLFIAPLSNPWTISGPRTYLPASGGCPEVREGPSFLAGKGGTSFMIYSACDTGKPDYQLWMKSIAPGADPLVAANWKQHAAPIMVRNDAMGIWGPGHNGFFKSPDGKEDWIVYHAKNTAAYTYEGRTTRIDKVSWTAEGLPSLAPVAATGAARAVPSGDLGGGPYAINDTDARVTYGGSWTAYGQCGVTCFEGNDHGTIEANATASFAFEGTQIALLSARDAANGIGAVSIDGGPEQEVDFFMSRRHGEQLVYVSPRLPYGKHTLKLRATGKKNGASAGIAISVDRAEVSTR